MRLALVSWLYCPEAIRTDRAILALLAAALAELEAATAQAIRAQLPPVIPFLVVAFGVIVPGVMPRISSFCFFVHVTFGGANGLYVEHC